MELLPAGLREFATGFTVMSERFHGIPRLIGFQGASEEFKRY